MADETISEALALCCGYYANRLGAVHGHARFLCNSIQILVLCHLFMIITKAILNTSERVCLCDLFMREFNSKLIGQIISFAVGYAVGYCDWRPPRDNADNRAAE